MYLIVHALITKTYLAVKQNIDKVHSYGTSSPHHHTRKITEFKMRVYKHVTIDSFFIWGKSIGKMFIDYMSLQKLEFAILTKCDKTHVH